MNDVSGSSAVEAPISRVIEFSPPGGNTIIGKNCSWEGKTYSKGATITDDGGVIQECSGDENGSWVPQKKSK
jgi:hypothetical protein